MATLSAEPRRTPIRRAAYPIAAALAAAVLMSAAAKAASLVEIVRDLPRLPADSIETALVAPYVAADFAAVLGALIEGNVATARRRAEQAGYVIRTVAEQGRRFRILHARRVGPAPVVIVAETAERDVIFEAPHPVVDRETGAQAALFLARLGGRAAIVSATHRCAARAPSPASGRTRVCGGGLRPYRDSDPAHNPETLFHRAHLMLARRWPAAAVVQLHGFAGRGSPTFFVLSDGSAAANSGDGSLAARVRNRIRAALGRAAAAVSCQDSRDRQYSYRRLCARSNVQGRQLNGSPDVLHKDAARSGGRFLHIEQQWAVRRPLRDDWQTSLADPRLGALFAALRRELPRATNVPAR